MLVERKLAALSSIFVAGWLTLSASAIEVTELAGAAHGYPGLCEANGKKLRMESSGNGSKIIIFTWSSPTDCHTDSFLRRRRGFGKTVN
jgi:hypothetical protein